MNSPAWSLQPPPEGLPDELWRAAEHVQTYPRKIVTSEGHYAIVFETVWSDNSSDTYITGFFPSLDAAASYSIDLFSTLTIKELKMNLLKNSKLFPNIRGVMLKEPKTLVMSGRVRITEMKDGNDARVEISFNDTDKTAIINRTQALNIIDVYGPETDEWKDKPVVLYGEEGTWFGKHTWGIRVDLEATRRASRNGNSKATA